MHSAACVTVTIAICDSYVWHTDRRTDRQSLSQPIPCFTMLCGHKLSFHHVNLWHTRAPPITDLTVIFDSDRPHCKRFKHAHGNACTSGDIWWL